MMNLSIVLMCDSNLRLLRSSYMRLSRMNQGPLDTVSLRPWSLLY